MRLPADQLGEGERVVLETREHWKHLLGVIGVTLLAIAGLVLVLIFAPDEGFFTWLRTVAWIVFGLIILIFAVWPWLTWFMKGYTLTNERLVTRTGVITRKGRDIPLDRINDVAFEQGLIDRMVKAGTLKVSAASEEGMVILVDIPEVHTFVLTMNKLVRDARDDNGR